MKNLRWLVVVATFSLAACGGGTTKEEAPAAGATPAAAGGLTQQPYASLAQVMRALPFNSANIIFDTQTNDPEAPQKEAAGDGGATARFSGIYKGWPLVEQSALALSETANLMLVPGRLCENGRPVPLDQEDFRKGIQALIEAGKVAHKAAQTKNMEQMIEASNTVTDACFVCHEVYRDVPDNKDRCIGKTAQ
jgi:hypothetical protein